MPKGLLYLLGIDVILKATAWHFLYHLPGNRIRGEKKPWVCLSLVPFGSLGFLLRGLVPEPVHGSRNKATSPDEV